MEGYPQPAGMSTPGKSIILSFPLSEMDAQQWRQIALQKSIVDDSALATFLLKSYQWTEKNQSPELWCQQCHSPLSQFCSMCFTLIPKHQPQISVIQTATPDTDADSGLEKETDQQGEVKKAVMDCGADTISLIPDTGPEQLSTSFPMSLSHVVADSDTNTCAEVSSDDEQPFSLPELEEDEEGVKFREHCSKPRGRKNTSMTKNEGGSEEVEQFQCELCTQVFSDPDLLVIHTQDHSDQMHHQCAQCKARFFQPHVLTMHMNIHSQKKKYPCDQCDVFMSRLDNLNRHKALKHKNKQHSEKGLGNSLEEGDDSLFKVAAKFTCETCQKGFARRDNFKRHLLTHSGEKRFGCQECGAAFPYLSKLVSHMHVHNTHKPFQCGKCHKCFADSASVTKHVCKANDPKHRCDVCEKTFPTSSQLILHSRLHLTKTQTSQTKTDANRKSLNKEEETLNKRNIGESRELRKRKTKTQVPRPYAPKSRPKRSIEKKGQGEVSPTSQLGHPAPEGDSTSQAEQASHPHQCEACGARFLFLSHLKRHQQQHSGHKAFSCPQCPVSCASLARLHIHQRSHRAPAHFPCHYCGKLLRSAYALRLHLCSHTGEKPFRCAECGECFSHRARYNDHMDVHSGERRHLCPYCGKAFLRSSNLSGHIRIHTHTKTVYPCQYCGKVLRSRNTLREHLRSHTGEKPFRCHLCGAQFMRSGTYKTHLRKHSGVKPHLCSFCGKAFLHPCHLKVHARIHTGEKPYKCSQCPKAFSIPASLKEHMRKHTGDKPFKCSVCGKAFAKSCNRLAHFRTHNKSQAKDPPPPPPALQSDAGTVLKPELFLNSFT